VGQKLHKCGRWWDPSWTLTRASMIHCQPDDTINNNINVKRSTASEQTEQNRICLRGRTKIKIKIIFPELI